MNKILGLWVGRMAWIVPRSAVFIDHSVYSHSLLILIEWTSEEPDDDEKEDVHEKELIDYGGGSSHVKIMNPNGRAPRSHIVVEPVLGPFRPFARLLRVHLLSHPAERFIKFLVRLVEFGI